MADDTAAAIAKAGETSADQTRVGTVIGYDSARITVRFSDGSVDDFPYLRPYQPLLGETVMLQARGVAWVAVGGFAGMPADNQVANPSFEEGTIGVFPPSWGLYHDPLSAAAASLTTETFLSIPPVEGSRSCQVQLTATAGVGIRDSGDYLYSAPIVVAAGQRWAASALLTGYRANPPDGWLAWGSVLLSWYANIDDVYPNTIAPDSQAMGALVPLGAPWVQVYTPGESAGIAVPAGANAMRVILLTLIVANRAAIVDITGSTSYNIYWDRVVAQRIS